MKKKILFLLVAIIVAVVAYFGFQSFQTIKEKEVFSAQIKHLPEPSVFSWLSKAGLKNQQKTIVLFFHPECEHCQYEAKTIVQQKEAFKDVNLWWVSIADTAAVKAFSKQYGLDKLSNAYMATLPAEKIISTFGSSAIPHLFIYDEQENLLKEFKRETKVEALLKYLK